MELITNLTTVINVLNNIEVKGLQNMDNLAGSIRILNEIVKYLSEMPTEQPVDPNEAK